MKFANRYAIRSLKKLECNMKPKILFLGTGIVSDGRFEHFYEPFRSTDANCHIISRVPEQEIFGSQGRYSNYHVYDYTQDEAEAFNYVSSFCREIGIDAIITLFEDAVILGSRVRSELGLDGLKYEQAIRFRNKYAMKQRFLSGAIPCARFAKIDSEEDVWSFIDEVGYPVILKPMSLFGTVSVSKCNNPEEVRFRLEHLLKKHPEGLLAEEYIAGTEMSCDSLVFRGKVIYSAVTYYDPVVIETMENKDVGLSVVLAADIEDRESVQLRILAQNVIDAMEFESGFTHMELFHSGDDYIVGEIAARPPGARIIDLHNISQGKNVGRLLKDIIIDSGVNFEFDRTYSSGVLFLTTGQRGVVAGVRGFDIVDKIENLVSYKFPKIGKIVGEKTNSCDDIGHIFFRSRHSAEITRTITDVRPKIGVTIGA